LRLKIASMAERLLRVRRMREAYS